MILSYLCWQLADGSLVGSLENIMLLWRQEIFLLSIFFYEHFRFQH